MMEQDPSGEGSKFSERLARMLRPELNQVLGFRGIELLELTVSTLELDDLLLVSNGDEIRISIVGKTMGCRP